jgi:shikimate kinase
MTTDKIYLVGFMGVGKTTVGAALAGRLGWQRLDLDEMIEDREHQAVAKIFASRGEAYFRSVERDILYGILPIRGAVVATGGGTFAEAENRAAINADGLSIWLDLPLEEIVRRLPSDGRRPLAADRQQLGYLYQARRFAYEQAHLRLDAFGQPAEALVEQVLDRLGW